MEQPANAEVQKSPNQCKEHDRNQLRHLRLIAASFPPGVIFEFALQGFALNEKKKFALLHFILVITHGTLHI